MKGKYIINMKLNLKYSKWLPISGYYAITIFNNLIRRDKYKDKPISQTVYNHESIHLQQELDFVFGCEKLYILGGIIFYILYLVEWILKGILSIFTLGKIKAYRSISFEQEAYDNEKNLQYLDTRKRFSWIKNVLKVK